jgi:tetratricopeptide (TPR) repeat protein
MALDNYLRIESIEELLKIFPSAKKYCAHPDADIEFVLAMTALESAPSAKHRLFGQHLLYNLLASPEKAEKLRVAHQFGPKDLVNITGQAQIFAPPPSPPAPRELEFPLERGIEAFNRKDHQTAIECLSEAMNREPDNPLPYAYLAFVCAEQRLTAEARDFINQATRLAPKRADLIAALGETFLKNDNPLEAVGYLREAVHREPDLFAAYPAFAQSLHLTGQSEEAISLLQTAANLPSDAQGAIRELLRQIRAERDMGQEESSRSFGESHANSLP